MRPIDIEQRKKVEKNILKYLNKIKRPTTIGGIIYGIGHNQYLISIGVANLEQKGLIKKQGRYITLK